MARVDVDGVLLAETDDAVLIGEYDDDDDGHWIPKSQIRDWPDHLYDRGDDVKLSVTEWIAKKKGLI